jgi:hypothetical protein
LLFLTSCNKEFSSDNYTAYFGGEIVNPNNGFVVLYKNNKVVDSIKLDANNRFFKKFDSLTPGMYTFKHDPEYQYLYFDKNDSIMVRVNSKDFDESLAFCGRGDGKNNFLMELYLKNEKDKDKMFEVFDYDFKKFNNYIDNTFVNNTKLYNKRKEELKWSKDFDVYATALLNYPHYTKKEIYPVIHKIRTGEDINEKLPKDYYDFRKKIDFSVEELADFSPYVMYIHHMLNNMSAINYHNHFTEQNIALKTNVNKLQIADTLIKNEKVKNTILNNIAFQYLLEDQNMSNNNLFLDTYYNISTDKTQKNEILKIGNAIQLLKPNFFLPRVYFEDINGKQISSDDLITKNTVFFFWTKTANTHLLEVHKKVIALQNKYPNFNFIGININDNDDEWRAILLKYNFKGVQEYKCSDFENLKAKWAITKIHRTIVVNSNKQIVNAFTNIFDTNFEENLK